MEVIMADEKQLLQDELVKLTLDLRSEIDAKLDKHIRVADWEDFKTKNETRYMEVVAKLAELQKPVIKANEKGDGVAGKSEYNKAFYNYVRTGELRLDAKAAQYNLERKALVEDVTGQILVPEEVDAEVYRTLAQINVMRGLCAVRTVNRDRLRLRGISEVSVGWGKLELGAAPLESTLVPVDTYQYVEDLEGLTKVGKDELMDSDVNIEPIISDSFARAMADIEESAFINGTGHANEQPTGITTAAAGVTHWDNTAAGAILMTDMMAVPYQVAPQYRRNGTFLVHSATELYLRQLRDAALGSFSWQPSLIVGKPNTLFGYPIVTCNYLNTLADVIGHLAIFGDFRAGYRIIDRMGMSIQRLIELYSGAGLIGFHASRRVGGSVINPNALVIMTEHA
jgi:HK97 family phage major capsid protein